MFSLIALESKLKNAENREKIKSHLGIHRMVVTNEWKFGIHVSVNKLPNCANF